MIVVEGPDGSGKTTLCDYLCRQFNLEMGERSEKDRDKIYLSTRVDSFKAMHDELLAEDKPRVWDRLGPWSEPIYAVHGIPVARQPVFTPQECHLFHDFIRQAQFGVLILCLPSLDRVLANVEESHQLEGVRERTKAIYNSYHTLVQNAFRYDYDKKGSLTAVSQAVSVHLRHRQKRERLATHT